jgi:hypothetical protein
MHVKALEYKLSFQGLFDLIGENILTNAFNFDVNVKHIY